MLISQGLLHIIIETNLKATHTALSRYHTYTDPTDRWQLPRPNPLWIDDQIAGLELDISHMD